MILGILASSISGSKAVTNSYESIAKVTVGSGGASSVEFTSIASTWTHLQLRVYALPNGQQNFGLQFNSDTGSNYSKHMLQGTGATVGAYGSSSQTAADYLGLFSDSSSYPAVSVIDILDYANTNKYKTIRALTGQDGNGTGTATDWRLTFGSGLWMNTNAITSIKTVNVNFRNYSHIALYGIKA